MADVFAFRGRAYYGKPGWEFRPTEVQEDFGVWRRAKSQDGKAVVNWLVKNGFRMVYRSFSRGTEARDYKEWWAKTGLVGDEGQVLPDQLRAMVARPVQLPGQPPLTSREQAARQDVFGMAKGKMPRAFR